MIKSAVVTGANSMIGIHIVRTLLERNIKVLAVARTISKELRSIPEEDNFKILQCDLSEIKNAADNITEKYDAFIHLAWAGTSGNARNDVALQRLNCKYTVDCVRLASKLDCKAFLGVGSQAEYGSVEGVISYDTLESPENAYGVFKYFAGRISRKVSKELGMKHVWVRVFSAYGPCNLSNTVVMQSIDAFLNGKSMKYGTTGEQMWNFLYAQDAADGILLALEKGKDGGVYCIANSENRTLKEYMYMVRDVANPNAVLEFANSNSSSVISLNVDVSREQKELGFTAKVPFKEGIKETIKWYKESKK